MKKTLTALILSLAMVSTGCASNIKTIEEDQTEYMNFNHNKEYISKAKARWLDSNTVSWDLPRDCLNGRFFLYYSDDADISIKNNKILGGERIELPASGVISNNDPLLSKYPYLLGHLKISTANIEHDRLIRKLQTKNLIVALEDQSGNLLEASRIQNYGVLDDLYAYTKDDLGVTLNRYKQPKLKLWAPTAQKVRVFIYKNPNDVDPEKTREMEYDLYTGVWSVIGVDDWVNKYYKYEVEVFSPLSGNLETNFVVDPYSVALSANGEKSQIADLENAKNMPEDWDTYQKPELNSFNDISLYELHVRDFSTKDSSVNEKYRGKFLAFTQKNSNGMKHLRSLANSGLTHVHLLPVFDFASVEENEFLRKDAVIENYESDSEEPQALVGKNKSTASYNWGYDPQNYFSPEGSYSTDPNGIERTLEFRKMVKSLNEEGLRVVMDVVYNHTFAAGTSDKSVLDKIVPGYYYRLDNEGKHQSSSCCPDTATEHNMMEKLMVDSIKSWAKNYKVDGFRFDLMGHHTKENLIKVREALDSLDLVHDGVDGKKIYLYGEGWKFGSLDYLMPNKTMNQFNSAGTGVGTFNDRMRDSARGGNFMNSTKSDQGFINGLYYDYNNSPYNTDTPRDLFSQRKQLFSYEENIKLALAGNLKDYVLNNKKGSDISYRNSQPTGYTESPQENINYVSAHDNYCLWDQNSAKHPFMTQINKNQFKISDIQEKVKMQLMGLSLVALGQGIPFFHAGDEILRSKSGDSDSYTSGDWFNAIDFSYQSNNWGIGLPPEWKNGSDWAFWKPRLASKYMKPEKKDILTSLGDFHRLLKIRNSSKLFRLETAKDIMDRVTFLASKDTEGREYEIPGVITMNISDYGFDKVLDQKRKNLTVVFNATTEAVTVENDFFKSRNLKVHEVLESSVSFETGEGLVTLPADESIKKVVFSPQKGKLKIPARSTVVLYEPRN